MQIGRSLIDTYKDLLFGRLAGNREGEGGQRILPDEELDRLVGLGLVRRGVSGDHSVIPPQVAAVSLALAVNEEIKAAHEDLLSVQQELQELHLVYEEAMGQGEQGTVQARILPHAAEGRESVISAILSAKSQVQVTLSPYTILGESCLVDALQLLSSLSVRGVRFTVTCDASLLHYPEFSRALECINPDWGEVSILPTVRQEIWCIDRRISIITGPSSNKLGGSQSATFLAECTELSSALHELCDMMHRQGIPYAMKRPYATSMKPMQQRVLSLLSGGYRDEEIANLLHVSVRTVRRYVSQLLDELSARTRFQAALIAAEQGIVTQASGSVCRISAEPVAGAS